MLPKIKGTHLPQVTSSVVDRVCDISRHFPLTLDVGCGQGHIVRLMSDNLSGSLYQLYMAERAGGESTMSCSTVSSIYDTTTDLPVYCTCWWMWLQVPHPLNSLLLSTDIAADQPLGSRSSHVQGGWRRGVSPVPSDTFDLAVSSLRYTHLATLGLIAIIAAICH